MAKKCIAARKESQIIDGVSGDFVWPWFVDIYDKEGKRVNHLLLYASKTEDSMYDQVGIIEGLMDGCAGKEGIPCIVVKIKGKSIEYKLDPLSFESTRIKEDETYSLRAMGWRLPEDISCTQDIIASFDSIKHNDILFSTTHGDRPKKRTKVQDAQAKPLAPKSPQGTKTTQKPSRLALKSPQESSISQALVVSVSPPITHVDDINPSSSPQVINAIPLVSFEVKGVERTFDFPNMVKKKGKKDDSGFHMFEKYFPFGSTTQFAIHVDRCYEAPPLYAYRTLCWDYVQKLTTSFVKNPMNPATSAYLMPFVEENGVKQPMHRDEVEVGKLQTYSYWIISGLHSIHAAKIYILSVTSQCMATKHLYTTRNARILVDCPAEMCIELSRMTNIESHNVMRNAPYLEQLQQLRDQWIAFGSPPKPQQGLPKSSPQRVPWEV